LPKWRLVSGRVYPIPLTELGPRISSSQQYLGLPHASAADKGFPGTQAIAQSFFLAPIDAVAETFEWASCDPLVTVRKS
jgi:hypothetical protein